MAPTRRAMLAHAARGAVAASARPLWQAGVALAAPLIAGCATPPIDATGVPQPPGGPVAGELDQTPFFPQQAFECGPAALATALGAAGITADPVQLAKQVFMPAREGSLQLEMITGARRAHGVATRIPGRTEAILQEIADGYPVVVLQNLGLDVLPVWHYAVVVGYSVPRQELVLRSGVNPRLVLSTVAFELSWRRAGSWALVITPPGDWPITATQEAVVEAAIGFERVAPPALARTVYVSGLTRWPGNLALMMGVGNTAFAGGDPVLAADSFERAARLHDSAAAWVNLGRTLLAADLPESAWRVALEASYLDDPKWREDTAALLRDAWAARRAGAGAGGR